MIERRFFLAMRGVVMRTAADMWTLMLSPGWAESVIRERDQLRKTYKYIGKCIQGEFCATVDYGFRYKPRTTMAGQPGWVEHRKEERSVNMKSFPRSLYVPAYECSHMTLSLLLKCYRKIHGNIRFPKGYQHEVLLSNDGVAADKSSGATLNCWVLAIDTCKMVWPLLVSKSFKSHKSRFEEDLAWVIKELK